MHSTFPSSIKRHFPPAYPFPGHPGDTITIPTDDQLLYALRASRGDDVYGEDQSTSALEARIAKLTGKEAAMFAASGTMTNREFNSRHHSYAASPDTLAHEYWQNSRSGHI